GSGGTYTVTASHVYGAPFHHALAVSIRDKDGSTATAGSTIIVGSENERFVAQVYRDLLGREAESQGLGFWLNLLSQGQTRNQIAVGIEGSLEFHQEVT